jgi:hypothetical protein
MKDLRTELYQLVYQEPMYPTSLCLDRAPFTHQELREQAIEQQIDTVIEKRIDTVIERDIWLRPDEGRAPQPPASFAVPGPGPRSAGETTSTAKVGGGH